MRATPLALSTPARAMGAALLVTLLVAVGVASTGCGRRATQEDCTLLVDKSVELQLKSLSQTSADEIAKREAQVRTELDGEIKACEGRRVTDKTMACVQAATTTEELDKCLR